MNIESRLLMNTHKVEKALSMPNRYAVFSQEIIKILISDINNSMHDIDLKIIVNQALSTILKYRNTLDISMEDNRKMVQWINENVNFEDVNSHHTYNHCDINQLSYSHLKHIVDNRHSVRNFLNKDVPIELIYHALNIATQMPSACNRQACSLKIINNIQIKEKLLCLQTGNRGIYAPLLGVIIGNNNIFTQDNEDFALAYHAGLFTAGFILGLQSLNISSCILNWHVDEKTNNHAKDILQLHSEQNIMSFLFMGFADSTKQEAYSYKKNKHSLIDIID